MRTEEKTMKCGLLGRRLGHSWSPLLHGMLGEYSYELMEREPEELEAFFRDPGSFDGINVTIPYKKTVMAFCDELSPRAKAVGAVNTVLRREGRLIGCNTDYSGFELLLEGLFEPAGKKVMVLGSGGASDTVCAVLRDRGGMPLVISRTGEDNYGNLSRHYDDTAAVINATPVGMYPDCPAALLELKPFRRLEAAADLIYNPCRSALLLEAERLGVPGANGLLMLSEQARAAAELFTGRSIGREKSRQLAAELAFRRENILLVGMPGCGKTTVGRCLAQKLHRPFLDSDLLVEERTGRSPAQWIREEGEETFRRQESLVLRDIGRGSGAVIAAGGGAVTRSENIDIIRQNSRVVWLQRPLERLDTADRPLSGSLETLRRLYAVREPLYEAAADMTMENEGRPEETAERLTEALREEYYG